MEFEKLLWDAMKPLVMPVLAAVGAISLMVLRKSPMARKWVLSLFFNGNGRGGGDASAAAAPDPVPYRRRDDQLLERVLVAYEANTKAMTELVETNRAIAETLKAQGEKVDRLKDRVDDGHGRIHERLDILLARPANG